MVHLPDKETNKLLDGLKPVRSHQRPCKRRDPLWSRSDRRKAWAYILAATVVPLLLIYGILTVTCSAGKHNNSLNYSAGTLTIVTDESRSMELSDSEPIDVIWADSRDEDWIRIETDTYFLPHVLTVYTPEGVTVNQIITPEPEPDIVVDPSPCLYLRITWYDDQVYDACRGGSVQHWRDVAAEMGLDGICAVGRIWGAEWYDDAKHADPPIILNVGNIGCYLLVDRAREDLQRVDIWCPSEPDWIDQDWQNVWKITPEEAL